MRRAVVDSSVAVKWFKMTEEESVEAALGVLENHISGELHLCAPAFFPLEIANALRYSTLSDEMLLECVGLLADYDVELMTPGRHRMNLTCQVARTFGLTVYDAAFLALAIELECPLITADRRAFAAVPPDIAHIRLL